MKLDQKTLKRYILITLLIISFTNELFCGLYISLFITIPSTIMYFVLFFIKHKNKIELEINPYINAIIISILLCFISDGLVYSHIIYKWDNILLVFMEYLFFIIPILLISIIKKPKIGYIIVCSIYFIFSFIQKYIINFKGYIFTINDVTNNLKSALGIKSSYTFSIGVHEITYIVYFIILITYICTFKYKPAKHKIIVSLTSISLICTIIVGYNLIYSSTYKNRITFGETWQVNNINVEICGTGLMNMFYCDAVYNKIKDPIDYSDEKAIELLDYPIEEYNGKPITIIAILNESWCNINHLYDTGIDYLPFWSSVDAIKGYVTVPVFGGTTCNSEYEFFTGNSCYYLTNTSVFSNYLTENTSSIVSYMKNMGFNTYCYSPAIPYIWNYENAYKYLGFDNVHLMDSILPKEDEKILGEMTDKALYNRVIKDIDNRDTSKSNFFYIATMQNHAPYNDTYDKYYSTNKNIETYINLAHDSDLELQNLIDHYKDRDDVVIIMFGDHYPILNYNFKANSTEDYAKIYQTPFIIWKKGIQNEFIDKISLNYLSNELFKVAGIPLSSMQQFLEKLRKEVPIISSVGYYDTEWHTSKNKFNDYHIVQWYNMFSKAI